MSSSLWVSNSTLLKQHQKFKKSLLLEGKQVKEVLVPL